MAAATASVTVHFHFPWHIAALAFMATRLPDSQWKAWLIRRIVRSAVITRPGKV